MRRVSVYWWQGVNRIKIGELAQKDSTIVYQWDTTFLNSQIELSPLSFKKSHGLITCPENPFNGLPGLFADNIPDGWGKILIKRGFHQMGLSADDFSPLDVLSYVGNKAMGALSFEPSLKSNEQWASGRVSLAALEQGVSQIIEGTESEVLNAFLESGASPNGIRPKIILKESKGKFYSGVQDLKASEWLIKFKAPEDPKDIGAIEYVYSLMAKKAGLNVPEARLFESKKSFVFGSKRFDKINGERFHLHTLSGILHASPGNFSVGYDLFSKVTRFLTKDQNEVEQVFKLASFNYFSCNQDDHTKNVAFLMDKKGEWKLAPFYDLTFHQTRANQHKMSLGKDGEMSIEALNKFGESIGLRKPKIKKIIDEVKESVSKFRILSKDLIQSKKERERILSTIESKLTINRGIER